MSIDSTTQIVINQGGVYTWQTVSAFVDGLFASNASSVVQEDAATQKLAVTQGTYQILGCNVVGNVSYTNINAVIKVDTTKLSSAPKMLNIRTSDGRTVICTAAANLITRTNNTLTSQPADAFNVDDPVACGLISHILTGNAPYVVRQVQYQNDNTPIPNIETATWGELTASRNDCLNFLSVLANDDSGEYDQDDVAVFNEVLTENVSYDTVSIKSDIQTPATLYDFEVDGVVYQLYNQVEIGVLPPMPSQ